MCADMGREQLGPEADGFVEGGVFLLSPSTDWRALLTSQPATKQRRSGTTAEASLLRDVRVQAEYRGYGRWRVRASR